MKAHPGGFLVSFSTELKRCEVFRESPITGSIGLHYISKLYPLLFCSYQFKLAALGMLTPKPVTKIKTRGAILQGGVFSVSDPLIVPTHDVLCIEVK